MHPDIAELVRYAGRKANVSVVTNGFLLRNGVIEALNEAGLNNLTVSVDTLHADPTPLHPEVVPVVEDAAGAAAEPGEVRRARDGGALRIVEGRLPGADRRDRWDGLPDVREPDPQRQGLCHDRRRAVPGAVRGLLRRGKPFTFLDYEYGKRCSPGRRRTGSAAPARATCTWTSTGSSSCAPRNWARLGKPLEEYTQADLDANAKTHKGCEEGLLGWLRVPLLAGGQRQAGVPEGGGARLFAGHDVRQQPQEAAHGSCSPTPR